MKPTSQARPAWRRRVVACAALACALAASGAGVRHGVAQKPAGAEVTENIAVATVFYEVRKGDTLERVAAEVYGDGKYAAFVAAANGLQAPRPLVPGERLTILVDRELVVAVGETFASIAALHLGAAMRGGFLATANGLDQTTELVAGVSLRVPLQASVTAVGGESLAELAARFYGDATGALLLRNYNALGAGPLRAGEIVLVPGLDMRVRPAYAAGLDEESRRRSARRQEMVALVAKALPNARAAWRDGNMAQVKRELVALDLDYLATAQALEAALLLGGSYIASEDVDSASVVFRRIVARAPRAAISAYHYPPKMCAVWRDAGGTVRDQP